MTLRQPQQARIVRQQRAAAAALFGRPADELIARLEVKGGPAPGGHGQPLALAGGDVAPVLTHERRLVQVVVVAEELIEPGGVLRRGHHPDLQVLQELLLLGGKMRTFCFGPARSLRKFRPDVPQKRLSPSPWGA